MTGELQRQYLKAMGVEVWQRRNQPDELPLQTQTESQQPSRVEETPQSVEMPVSSAPVSAQEQATEIAPADVSTYDWDALSAAVKDCTQCQLCGTRTQSVFGTGDRNATWMVVGEAPGADEDRQGEPFVGKAGQLLNEMLRAIGLQREQVYIANILKCRPPNNRDPRPEEVLCCEPYLKRQIELIQPTVILAVGRIAAQNLLKSEAAIGRLRGKQHYYPGSETPVVVTYHPAYLLRSPSEKRKAWQDLQMARVIVKNRLDTSPSS